MQYKVTDTRCRLVCAMIHKSWSGSHVESKDGLESAFHRCEDRHHVCLFGNEESINTELLTALMSG